MLAEHVNFLVCPDCSEPVREIEVENQIVGFFCERCQMIYPIKDGILIFLAKEVRNYELEYPLILKIQAQLSNGLFGQSDFYAKTLDLLKSKKGLSTWEWQDEQFWSREYTKEMRGAIRKVWNDRIWQREFLIQTLVNQLDLKGKSILDVGCGEGQNFRELLSRRCAKDNLYIATDISFEALVLNRSRNAHKNSLFVLCSEDYQLPFRNNTIDLLCYFGILHHTKNKTNNIQKDKTLLKRNGFVIIVESIDRPLLPLASIKMFEEESSLHEEHINKNDLFTQLSRKNYFEIVYYKEEGTPFLTGMMKIFRDIILSKKRIFLLILYFDALVAKTLGKISPYFSGGEVQILAKARLEP
jgi:ubiquinone/menaquinone biosynthesis C-methylase UbiE/uncharacterized protein YbaR (Trm112 family)